MCGRPTSYRNTGPSEVSPASDVDVSGCKSKLTIIHRNIEWRGEEVKVKTAEQRRAVQIYTRGVLAPVPCSKCAARSGPFKHCVVAFNDNGWVGNGVCANCTWLHRTDECTWRFVLPCTFLHTARRHLGPFDEVCKIHCGGLHAHLEHMNIFAQVPPALLFPAAFQLIPSLPYYVQPISAEEAQAVFNALRQLLPPKRKRTAQKKPSASQPKAKKPQQSKAKKAKKQ